MDQEPTLKEYTGFNELPMAAVLLVGIPIGILLFVLMTWVLDVASGSTVAVVTLLVGGFLGGLALLRYLRSDPAVVPSERIVGIEERIRELQRTLTTLAIPESTLSEEEIRSEIRRATTEILSDNTFSELEAPLQERARVYARKAVVKEAIAPIIARLMDQLQVNAKRANLNLVLGVFAGVAGIILLIYITVSNLGMMAPHDGANMTELARLLIALAPRIGSAIVIELFAFYFLGLYRSSLPEAKYYQNELTTLQTRFASLEVALSSECQKAVEASLLALGSLDRNHVLEVGQTTAEIERFKTENSALRAFVEQLAQVVSRK